MSTEILKFNKKKINIAENLKKLRQLNSITVKEFSQKTNIEENTLRKYETDFNMPILQNLITISNYFGFSIDFILIWDKSNFTRNIKLLNLAEKIDKMDFNERYKVEATDSSLIGNMKNLENTSKQDEDITGLTDNINENIRTLRIKKDIPQQKNCPTAWN